MRTGQDRGQVKIVLIIQALCVPGGTGCEGQCVEEVESALNKWYVMRGLGDKSCLCVYSYSMAQWVSLIYHLLRQHDGRDWADFMIAWLSIA